MVLLIKRLPTVRLQSDFLTPGVCLCWVRSRPSSQTSPHSVPYTVRSSGRIPCWVGWESGWKFGPFWRPACQFWRCRAFLAATFSKYVPTLQSNNRWSAAGSCSSWRFERSPWIGLLCWTLLCLKIRYLGTYSAKGALVPLADWSGASWRQ